MKLDSLEALFTSELRDIYDAENRFVSALPRMAAAAEDTGLQAAFEDHMQETQNHIRRLDEIFEAIDVKPQGEVCEAAQGLIAEAEQIIAASGAPEVKDAALIGAAQRIEHYEMAAYGAACALANQLEFNEVADLLHETLEEEKGADKKLTRLAKGGVFSEGINDEARKGAMA